MNIDRDMARMCHGMCIGVWWAVCLGWLAAVCSSTAVKRGPTTGVEVDPHSPGLEYDGHGGLSAGASSRSVTVRPSQCPCTGTPTARCPHTAARLCGSACLSPRARFVYCEAIASVGRLNQTVSSNEWIGPTCTPPLANNMLLLCHLIVCILPTV